MPTSTNVTNLKINELTEAQYDTAVQGGVIGENELSIITDLDDAIQVTALPTAGADEFGKVYQFIGTTDANYTHGYFYECVSDGQTPATYSWTAVQVQASSGGGLPSQTGNSGKFLTTDGTDASWSDKPFVNKATGSLSLGIFTNNDTSDNTCNNNSVALGTGITATGSNSVAIGTFAIRATSTEAIALGSQALATGDRSVSLGGRAQASNSGSVAIGNSAQATGAYSIQISSATAWNPRTNSDANTFKVGNYNGNYEMMSANGTIPTDRFTTTPSADGTYVPNLSIASGTPTRSWASLLDILSSVSGYDATKTQTLKNVAGTLTWVDD